MTKAQLIAENFSLRNSLRIVCTQPTSYQACLIKITQIHIAKTDKMIWNGDMGKTENVFKGISVKEVNLGSGLAGIKTVGSMEVNVSTPKRIKTMPVTDMKRIIR